MNNQSDYGYHLPEIQNRTRELCAFMAQSCRKSGRRDWAKEWIREGKLRQKASRK